MNKKLILATALAAATSLSAQTLTLDSCRALALRNNKQLRMSALKIEAAHWQHKSAQSNYYPRITAVGTYQRTSREVQLLSDEQQDRLVHIGTNAASAIRNGVHQGVADFQQGITQLMSSPQMAQMLGTPEMAQMLQQNPLLLQLISNPSMIGQLTEPMLQRAATAFNGMLTSMESLLNSGGQSIVDAFRTDTRNMTGATIMLTQPLYMGGKIRAYDKITRLAEEAAGAQHTLEEQDLLVSVDEAYWRIINLQSKKKLAESFVETVSKLDSDVQRIIDEGLATKADGLSVKVKLNEAEVALIQVENGLVLSRMALAQLCGLPLQNDFQVVEPQSQLTTISPDEADVVIAMENRPELKALDIAAQVKKEQVKVARSEYMPNLALTAGYLFSNPNLLNGFEKKFSGMWTAGLVLKVPVITWGDRIFKVRQAKAEAAIAATRVEEVREKITLQVNQNQQKLQEAQQRLATAQRSQDQADENLRMANLGLAEGVIPVSNVLQAQTAWLSAHSTLVEAEIDVRLADLYLQRALGTISY